MMMLPFQEQVISDLLDDPNGGLVVLSSGLPLSSLVASLLLLLRHPSSGEPDGAGRSILLLSASDSQKSSISAALRRLQCDNDDPQNPNPVAPLFLPSDVPGDLPSHQRSAIYSSGGALFVTPRVLIADLLTSRVPRTAVAALLILNAHRLSDVSTEAFVTRVLRPLAPSTSGAPPIFAFSDRPHAMVSGFAKAERIMKCLFVRRLHLWPRFHILVSSDLERSPPEVVDIRVPMTPAMRGIQAAVLEAMDACLKELRKSNKVDVEDLTVENGLFKSFDEIVRRQLDPIWHTLGKKTKQLVSDLKTLRKLLDYLVRYDAVTFLKYLDTLRISEGVRSVWIFADSSHKIFEYAKRRVYQVVRADGLKINADHRSTPSKKSKVTSEPNKQRGTESGTALLSEKNHEKGDADVSMVLDEVLEEAPKWKLLRELLEEIEEERKKDIQSREGQAISKDVGVTSDIVLVACKDERSCLQLEDCIVKGSHQVMQQEWGKYLLGKVELHKLQKRNKKRPREPKGFGVIDGIITTSSAVNAEPSSISKLENDVLLAAALEINKLSKRDAEVADSSKKGGRHKLSGKAKGKPRTNNVKSKVQVSSSKGRKPKQNSKTESNCSTNEERDLELKNKSVQSPGDAKQESTPINRDFQDLPAEVHDEELNHFKPLPPVQFYALDSDQHILDVFNPSVIIVYHPDMTFVREIEVYKAQNPLQNLKVYFLFYDDSTEVQKFEASIRRENGAFESLIRQKSLMMIPVDQNGRCIGPSISNEPQSVVLENSSTRKAGGRKPLEKETQVVVDMREFMSSLPNVLHLKGMRVIPATLEVGDYILSPLICVERKSIADLFQSFASGRLYHQVEAMNRYYRMPVLLIEFSQDKSFSFQSASDLGDDVSPTSIISKLSLLVLHFPRLRLVWSRSVHATAEIFASLKQNQDEPDQDKAVRVGVPSEDGFVENDVRTENYNTPAIEFLRRLPGVTDSNYRALMDECKDLAEIALLPVERLAELMGGQKPARMLREFLDAKCPIIL